MLKRLKLVAAPKKKTGGMLPFTCVVVPTNIPRMGFKSVTGKKNDDSCQVRCFSFFSFSLVSQLFVFATVNNNVLKEAKLALLVF